MGRASCFDMGSCVHEAKSYIYLNEIDEISILLSVGHSSNDTWPLQSSIVYMFSTLEF